MLSWVAAVWKRQLTPTLQEPCFQKGLPPEITVAVPSGPGMRSTAVFQANPQSEAGGV